MREKKNIYRIEEGGGTQNFWCIEKEICQNGNGSFLWVWDNEWIFFPIYLKEKR